MSEPKKTLGGAVRIFIRNHESSEEAVKRRFDAMVTADSPEELANHLRGIVQLLKSDSIPLDYPRLAEELFKFQFSELRDGIRLRWGQDYFSVRKDEENEDK